MLSTGGVWTDILEELNTRGIADKVNLYRPSDLQSYYEAAQRSIYGVKSQRTSCCLLCNNSIDKGSYFKLLWDDNQYFGAVHTKCANDYLDPCSDKYRVAHDHDNDSPGSQVSDTSSLTMPFTMPNTTSKLTFSSIPNSRILRLGHYIKSETDITCPACSKVISASEHHQYRECPWEGVTRKLHAECAENVFRSMTAEEKRVAVPRLG